MAKARYHERTLRMMNEFMPLHEQGYTIAEIAEKYSLSVWAVYDHLGEIAKKNHVSRDSLLQVIHSNGWNNGRNGSYELIKIDSEAFEKKVKAAVEDIDEMINDINMALKDYEG